MTILKYILALLTAMVGLSVHAQDPLSLRSTERFLNKARQFADDDFAAGVPERTGQYMRQSSLLPGLHPEEATLLTLLTALKTEQPGAEENLETWAEANGESPYASQAYLQLGRQAFRDKRWEKVVSFYSRISPTKAGNESEQGEYHFQYGYALLSLKEFDKALTHFDAAKKGSHDYRAGAHYYSAYLALRTGNYSNALRDLEVAERDKTYANYVPVLRANLYYRQRNYDKVLEQGMALQKDSSSRLPGMEDVTLLLGEAYYMKGDYQKAGRYYNQYQARVKTGGGRVLQYRIGHSQYMLGNYAKAVPALVTAAQSPDTSAGKADTIAQAASYYLGASYLKQKNLQYALNAFVQARYTRGDAKITEQAWLQAGRCLFELGRYDAALQ